RPVTFTATVSAPASTAVPTGTVTFVIDGGSQATVDVDSGGHASFSTSSLLPGPHTVVAQFNTNSANFLNGASGALTQRVRKDYFVTGGTTGEVRIFDATTGAILGDFLPYGPSFTGGVTVAVGDVNGDGFADIATAPASGVLPVMIFSGRDLSLLGALLPYGAGFSAGVFVAVGDMNGDGLGDIITGAGGVAPHVKVFSGADGSLIASFYAYAPNFAGGVRVAAADLDGDDRADIVTAPGAGFPPLIKIFSTRFGGELGGFFAYGANLTAGVFVALGDVDGDGHADIITGAGGLAPHVEVFSGTTAALEQSFLAYPGSSQGVRVGAVDRNGDGRADLITVPTGSPPVVRIVDGLTLADLDAFFAFGSPLGAAFVAGSA
ncbi:MAG: FG-GAP repeat protein, partial [Planctomycetes bacterium]|nr:FG-GAP repeat protein [Planctomycetota bacterium]